MTESTGDGKCCCYTTDSQRTGHCASALEGRAFECPPGHGVAQAALPFRITLESGTEFNSEEFCPSCEEHGRPAPATWGTIEIYGAIRGYAEVMLGEPKEIVGDAFGCRVETSGYDQIRVNIVTPQGKRRGPEATKALGSAHADKRPKVGSPHPRTGDPACCPFRSCDCGCHKDGHPADACVHGFHKTKCPHCDAKKPEPDIEPLAEKAHEAWMKEKQRQGFADHAWCSSPNHEQTWCKTCSPNDDYPNVEGRPAYRNDLVFSRHRHHPNMVPYKDLPEEAKEFDRAMVRAVLEGLR